MSMDIDIYIFIINIDVSVTYLDIIKELILCHKLRFYKSYIIATHCHGPMIL